MPSVAPTARSQPQLEPFVRETLRHALAPLDHRDRVVQRRVEVEVVELLDAPEPVGVDVDQGRPLTADGCTRAITNVGEVISPRTPRPGADPLGQRGLPGTEVAGEDDDVAAPEYAGQGDAEGPRVARRCGGSRVRGNIFASAERDADPARRHIAVVLQNVDRLGQLHPRT